MSADQNRIEPRVIKTGRLEMADEDPMVLLHIGEYKFHLTEEEAKTLVTDLMTASHYGGE